MGVEIETFSPVLGLIWGLEIGKGAVLTAALCTGTGTTPLTTTVRRHDCSRRSLQYVDPRAAVVELLLRCIHHLHIQEYRISSLMLTFIQVVIMVVVLLSLTASSSRRLAQSFRQPRSGLRMSMSTVKVATYNVLSSHLGGADYYTACKPGNLDAKARLERVKAKLDRQIASKAIICLQEVSTSWAGELHSYFAKAGYHFVTGLYGRRFNGYFKLPLDLHILVNDALILLPFFTEPVDIWGSQLLYLPPPTIL